jgi:DNA-binding MarR family transcriptional regulator
MQIICYTEYQLSKQFQITLSQDDRQNLVPHIPAALAAWTSVLLNKAADKTRNQFNDRLADLKIQSKHYGILVMLADRGTFSQAELGVQLGIDRASMVKFIDRLEQLKLVERIPNPHDRRAYTLALTEQGRSVLAQANQIATIAEADFLAPLADAEKKQLHQFLVRLLGISPQ